MSTHDKVSPIYEGTSPDGGSRIRIQATQNGPLLALEYLGVEDGVAEEIAMSSVYLSDEQVTGLVAWLNASRSAERPCDVCGAAPGRCMTATICQQERASRSSDRAHKGWKLVPETPTPEMLQAAVEADIVTLDISFRDVYTNIYRAVIAAAPVAPASATQPSVPAALFDGYAVYEAMGKPEDVSPRNVAAVLDAVVRLIKAEGK